MDRPDGVIIVVDASNLERNLYLASQVLDLNLPTIVVCNMMDIVRKRGDRIDLARLSRKLGVPVVGTVGTTREGIDALRTAIVSSMDQAALSRPWRGSERFETAVADVGEWARSRDLVNGSADAVALLLLSPSVLNDSEWGTAVFEDDTRRELAALHQKHNCNGQGALSVEAVEMRYRWLGEVVEGVLDKAEKTGKTTTDRIDEIVTHRVWGLLSFSAVMGLMFLAIFSWAAPIMDGIDGAISLLGTGVAHLLGSGMLTDLLVDGVIAGVGAVLVFFPQICILFLFIALLEDSGYMARAAFVMDRVMSAAGLHGKSFIPLLSGFACAVPAIMATRTIENRRDRLATMLVVPLMGCSARLPIYLVLISAIFGERVFLKSGIMFVMYALGLVTAWLMAGLLKRTLLRGPTPTFLMELPPYRMPKLGTALRHMWDRSKQFLIQAGSIILAFSIVLWALAYFPRAPETAVGEAGDQLRQSYMGRVGRVMEPVIKPLGFDWKIGVGLAASFAAREVFVSTMGVVYGVGADADETSKPLRAKIAAATWPDGSKVYTPLVGISLMVFYVLACQCVSTLAVLYRETKSLRWPTFLFCYMTALAYAGSLIVYQGGRALGWG